MDNFSRRQFLKGAAILGAGAVALPASHAEAKHGNVLSPDRKGVLVDTTVCVGCRQCELACKIAHDLPTGDVGSYQDRSVFKTMRRPDDNTLTVVNEFKNPKNELLPINVKVQCMHCDHPACVSACIVGAIPKSASAAATAWWPVRFKSPSSSTTGRFSRRSGSVTSVPAEPGTASFPPALKSVPWKP